MARFGTEDKQQIGLTPTGEQALERLMAAGLFDAEVDAYRCAIAYALGRGLSPEEAATSNYGTKYNAAGTLDRDGTIRDLLAVLDVGAPGRPYATAEKLADLGIIEMDRRIAAHESMADIMLEALQQAPQDETAESA